MAHYLIEDPVPLLAAAGVVVAASLLALRLTQRGAFLIAAIGAALVGLAAFVVERAWVTDAERIEAVVLDVARAVERGDADAVVARLAPDAELEWRGARAPRLLMVPAIRAALKGTQFDNVTVVRLRADAGAQTRMGTAVFEVHTSGAFETDYGTRPFMTHPKDLTEWSMGFREAAPGDWKVTRITAVRLPSGADIPGMPGGR